MNSLSVNSLSVNSLSVNQFLNGMQALYPKLLLVAYLCKKFSTDNNSITNLVQLIDTLFQIVREMAARLLFQLDVL